MNPSRDIKLFGWNLSFDRGRFVLARLSHCPLLAFIVWLPWAYYDPNEYDGFAGYIKVFKLHADTQFELIRDPEVGFWYAKLVVLGFGISFTYQGTH